jgi:hypothetical protein
MGKFRQVEGAGRFAGKRKRKKRESEAPEDWTSDWRVEGVAPDRRFKNMGEAQSAQRRVRRMKPQGPKGKKQTGGRRPGPETAERIVHSQGKKWDEFEEALGGNLSEYEMRLLFDGRKIGGAGTFADWKQERHEDRRVVKSEIIFQTFKGPMVSVRDEDTGKMKLVPWVPSDPVDVAKAEKVKNKLRKKRDIFATFCEECGMKLPTSRRREAKCATCAPASASAQAFGESLRSPSAERK